jgi:hypothetical protein
MNDITNYFSDYSNSLLLKIGCLNCDIDKILLKKEIDIDSNSSNIDKEDLSMIKKSFEDIVTAMSQIKNFLDDLEVNK